MNATIFIATIRDYLPKKPESLMALQGRLEKMSQEKQDEFYRMKFPLIELKNPSVILLINFFFGVFGVGRFMVGDNALGGLRLILTFFPLFLIEVNPNLDDSIVGFLGFLFLSNLIWWLVDLYFVDQKVRQQNLAKILQIL